MNNIKPDIKASDSIHVCGYAVSHELILEALKRTPAHAKELLESSGKLVSQHQRKLSYDYLHLNSQKEDIKAVVNSIKLTIWIDWGIRMNPRIKITDNGYYYIEARVPLIEAALVGRLVRLYS